MGQRSFFDNDIASVNTDETSCQREPASVTKREVHVEQTPENMHTVSKEQARTPERKQAARISGAAANVRTERQVCANQRNADSKQAQKKGN